MCLPAHSALRIYLPFSYIICYYDPHTWDQFNVCPDPMLPTQEPHDLTHEHVLQALLTLARESPDARQAQLFILQYYIYLTQTLLKRVNI
jgi:hypothetical protein